MNLLKNIYNNYFSLNLKSYDKIGVDLEINKVLLFVFIGLCIATVIISINQMNTSLLLKKLLRLEAFSESKARTLGQLGLDQNFVIKGLLSKTSGRLISIITFVGFQRPSYEDYVNYEKTKKSLKFKPAEAKKDFDLTTAPSLTPDLKTAAIYISENNVDAAEELYKRNSTSILKTVLACLLILVAYVAIMLLMPSILSLVNSIIA